MYDLLQTMCAVRGHRYLDSTLSVHVHEQAGKPVETVMNVCQVCGKTYLTSFIPAYNPFEKGGIEEYAATEHRDT